MTDPVEIAITIYLVGVVVAAIIAGAIIDECQDDWLGGWVFAALWPIVALAVLALVVCGAPFWLGKAIRRTVLQEKT